jgi:replication stress response regulator SDE2
LIFDPRHRLAAYLESEPERKKAASEARKAKIVALERQLGIESSSSKGNEGAGTKRRFDDTEYLEQSREIVDSVKSAVTAGISTLPVLSSVRLAIDMLVL